VSEAEEKYTIDKNGIKRRARRTYTAEFKQLLMENDILKQAALIFGRKENQR